MTDNFLSILCFKKGHRAACVNESFRFVAIVLSIAKDLLREIRVRGFMLESQQRYCTGLVASRSLESLTR